MRHAVLVGQVLRPHIGLRVKAVCHHAPIRDAANQRLNLGVIGAANGQTVEGNIGHEIMEAFAQGIERAPVFHMFGINVGDHGDGGGQAVEGAVGFVRLDHHPFATAHAGVTAISVDDAAVDHRRVQPASVQQCGHHRGGGGFAVGAGNRHIGFQAHQFGQHFSAAHHGQAASAGLVQFGVAGFDGG